MGFAVDSPEGVVISLKAKPRSSKPGIEKAADGSLVARIKSAPVDGKANRELAETLADRLGVAKSRVKFKSGEASRTKRLVVSGMDAAEAERLLG